MGRANNHSDILYHCTGKGGLEALLEIMKNGFMISAFSIYIFYTCFLTRHDWTRTYEQQVAQKNDMPQHFCLIRIFPLDP